MATVDAKQLSSKRRPVCRPERTSARRIGTGLGSAAPALDAGAAVAGRPLAGRPLPAAISRSGATRRSSV